MLRLFVRCGASRATRRPLRSCVLPAASLVLCTLFTPSAAAQCLIQKLLAEDGAPQDVFGKSIAVHDGWALVGKTDLDDFTGEATVYAFEETPAGWVQRQKFVGSDTVSSGTIPADGFGFTVAMDGGFAAVASDTHAHAGVAGTGAVYVFELSGTQWVEVAEFYGAGGTYTGLSLAMHGDTIVAGAIGYDLGSLQSVGAAYVYERTASGWAQTGFLVPSDAESNDTYGRSVAVWNDTIVVASERDDGYLGAAYVYERSPTGWIEGQKLRSSDGEPNDNFGWSAAVSEAGIVIGAATDSHGTNGAVGAAYVYEETPAGWVERAKLTPSDGESGDQFTYTMAMEGDTLCVGALFGDGIVTDSGAVYVYRRTTDGWKFAGKLASEDGAPLDAFGNYLDIDGEIIGVGSIWDDDNGDLSGSAYLISFPSFATPYGFCANSGACGNGDPLAGCENSTGRGALLSACGSGSVSADDFTVSASDLPPDQYAVVFYGGDAVEVPFGDGFQLVSGGAPGLFRSEILFSGRSGTIAYGPGFVATTPIQPGETWFLQAWYRDPGGPCGTGVNLSNAIGATFRP